MSYSIEIFVPLYSSTLSLSIIQLVTGNVLGNIGISPSQYTTHFHTIENSREMLYPCDSIETYG